MKKILIIGEKFSPNLGDALIFNIVDKIFKEKYSTDFLDLSGRDEYKSDESSNYSVNDSTKGKIIKKCKLFFKKIGFLLKGKNMITFIKKFEIIFMEKVLSYKPDIILFAGGQLFMDSFFEQIKIVVKFCDKNNIPVIFNACGCSNKIYLYEKKCLKKIVNSDSVKYISLRDGYNIVKKYDNNEKVHDTFDTALLCSNFMSSVDKKTILGIGIMYTSFYEYKIQFDFWSDILKFVKDNNIEYRIFCNGSIDDYKFINEICKENNIDSNLICDRPLDENQLVKCISSFNSIVSMRLHSLIVAHSFCIPSVAIAWDKKVLEFYKKINRETFCFRLDDDICKIKNSILNLNKIKISQKQLESINDIIMNNIKNIYDIIDGKENNKYE